jgi:predicted DNA-binding protein
MSTARVTIRIDESLHERLESVAQTAGKTESQVVREALEDYLDRNQSVVTAYDLFKKAGVIGCYKGGPRDLSTNPKYMEGFGRD